jgi:hypothetical protein
MNHAQHCRVWSNISVSGRAAGMQVGRTWTACFVQGDGSAQQKRVPEMSIAEAVFAILGTVVTALTAEATLLWWVYKRGEAAGAEKAGRDAAQAAGQARIEQLARELAETRAELTALQSKRRKVS